MLQVEPVIQKENLGIVHHVVVYGCYDTVDREHYFEKNQTGYGCLNTANMPKDLNRCRTAIFAWGVGGGVSISLRHSIAKSKILKLLYTWMK